MITHVANKVIVNQKQKKCNNQLRALLKENIKYRQFNLFSNYYTRNKNEIKRCPKTRVTAKETSYKTEI